MTLKFAARAAKSSVKKPQSALICMIARGKSE
jgi:hypothetical protein